MLDMIAAIGGRALSGVDNNGVIGPPISTTVTLGDTNRLLMPYCEPNNVSDSSNDITSGGSLVLRDRKFVRVIFRSEPSLCFDISM